MATNSYFNNFSASNEQGLLEDLIIESIRIYGMNMYYIPRVRTNFDKILNEDDQSEYNSAYMIEMYIKNVDGFGGNSDFLSKFGVEIRDQVTFTVARKVFNNYVTANTTQPRPFEGDVIYFPLNKKVFQITYVNNFEVYYPLGKLQTWEITAELFEYSGEKFNTGIPEVDSIQKTFDTNQYNWTVDSEDGFMLVNESGELIVLEGSAPDDLFSFTMNDELQKESDKFVDFSEIDPFSLGDV